MRIQDHLSISVNLDVAQASCDRLTENVCAVCDVMEMCVSDCIRISEKHGTHVFGRKTPVMLATASAQVCVPLGHSSLYLVNVVKF